MNPIPEIALKEHYRKDFEADAKSQPGHLGTTLPNFLIALEKGVNNPVTFRKYLFAVLELYLNSIIGDKAKLWAAGKSPWNGRAGRDAMWNGERAVLEDLCIAAAAFTDSFYRGEPRLRYARAVILSNDDGILSRDKGKALSSMPMDIEYDSIQRFGLALPGLSEKIGAGTDTVIGVAPYGLELSFLAMGILGVERQLLLRHSRYTNSDKKVRVPSNAPESYFREYVQGKRILAVLERVSSEEDLGEIVKYLTGMGPAGIAGIALGGNPLKLPFIEDLNHSSQNGYSPFVCRYVSNAK